MRALPTLTSPERRMLMSVRHGHRDSRWDHPTLNALGAQQLVTSVTIQKAGGGLSVNRRWSITERGIAAYQEQC